MVAVDAHFGIAVEVVAEGEAIEGAIPFDMFGAEFSHHGEDCTFETMLKRFGLTENKGLREIAEIVHDIDLKDDKFGIPETAGIGASISGICAAEAEDLARLERGARLFDELLAHFGSASRSAGRSRMRSGKASRKRTIKEGES